MPKFIKRQSVAKSAPPSFNRNPAVNRGMAAKRPIGPAIKGGTPYGDHTQLKKVQQGVKTLSNLNAPTKPINPATATDALQQKQAILKQRISRPPKALEHSMSPMPHQKPPNSPGSSGGPGVGNNPVNLRKEMMRRLRKRGSFAS